MTDKNLNEEAVRLGRLESLQQQGIDSYPSSCQKTHTIAQARELSVDSSVVLVGRLVSSREMGKLCFAHLKDFSGKIQLAVSEKDLGKDKFKFFTKNFDIGDFLEVKGKIFITHKGEISVLVEEFKIIAKALLPMPEKFHGLSDIETRYRQRYLDLLANDESMKIAVARSLLVKELRNYFNDKGFYEVETPILQSLYGGANAKPFVTHHNALGADLFLRIAPELYLKRLIVGGFEKVYEVAKCFRNEGIDNNHNPEFTQIEFYWAYANYQDLMNLMEDLLPRLIKAMNLPLKMTVGEQEVDFTPPYPRITMREIIKQYAKIDIEDYPDQKSLFEKAKELKIDGIDKNTGRGKLVDEIYKTYARPNIINPVFKI
ncbi:MAG TPA: OB-fold nucleic acid binding domain-containing protein [Candidatus Magasanikbacteria bacterium]|nr:OB-fold nucleic acid binding domain-containing protein [Candidatus Magasanikbacteria bacterium]